MTRDPSWPDPDHPLLRAARENDAHSDNGQTVDEVMEAVGLDVAAAEHLAGQRAGMIARLDPSVDPSWLAAALLDGIAIGWRAHSLAGSAFGVGQPTAAPEVKE